MNINDDERRVLTVLLDANGYEGFDFCNFSFLCNETRLERKTVRRACRSLTRKGLAEFSRGLWNDEGPAGSGYAATTAGKKAIQP
jgi:DNA-binding MarR family transcriptional regulator